VAHLFPNIKQKFFNSDGEPLAGGLLYSYVAGTTTLQATYTDASAVTPNPNPVVLDANGEANIWIGPGAYKFQLTDADDAVQWTVDNVSHIDANYITAAMIKDGEVTSAKLAANVLSADAVGRSKMAEGFLSADAAGRAKMAPGYITRQKLAPVEVLSSDPASLSILSFDYVDVPTLFVTITTTGKPVFVGLTPAAPEDPAYIGASTSVVGFYRAQFRLMRATTVISTVWVAAYNTNEFNTSTYVPPGSLWCLLPVAAGTHTFKVQIAGGVPANAEALVSNCKLIAYEIG